MPLRAPPRRRRALHLGTGKVTALAVYTSALFLGAVAAWMAWESVSRLFAPVTIRYGEAIVVAVFEPPAVDETRTVAVGT